MAPCRVVPATGAQYHQRMKPTSFVLGFPQKLASITLSYGIVHFWWRSMNNAALTLRGSSRLRARFLSIAFALTSVIAMHLLPAPAFARDHPASTSDADLVASLPGFTSRYADVNGIRLHYVEGGSGEPLILLPGWPETWWSYHKVMPELARNFHVISVDIRGMGLSSKPAGGYDKKTMAADIAALVKALGYSKVNVAGHDIGAMVGFAYAAQHQNSVIKLAILDVPHPDDGWMKIPMLPEVGRFGSKIDDAHPVYPWWFAFHQVKGLPEQLLADRLDIYLNYCLDYLSVDPTSIDSFDREVYADYYSIPAGDAWYQAFAQDVIDARQYPTLEMPVLGLGSVGYEWLRASLPSKAKNVQFVKIENSGHFFMAEQPERTTYELTRFFRDAK